MLETYIKVNKYLLTEMLFFVLCFTNLIQMPISVSGRHPAPVDINQNLLQNSNQIIMHHT